MSKNRIRLNICGAECVVGSDEDEGYVRTLGAEVQKGMNDMMTHNERVSITMAAIITALDYCDVARKATAASDNLRSQIKDYLEDSSRARMETEESRREIERMRKEIQTLRARLAGEAGEPVQEQRPRPIAPGSPVQRPSVKENLPQKEAPAQREAFPLKDTSAQREVFPVRDDFPAKAPFPQTSYAPPMTTVSAEEAAAQDNFMSFFEKKSED